jgi:hypothetical protein
MGGMQQPQLGGMMGGQQQMSLPQQQMMPQGMVVRALRMNPGALTTHQHQTPYTIGKYRSLILQETPP